MRTTMTVLGAFLLFGVMTSTVSAAPPADPVLTLNTPIVECDGANELTITASVETDTELAHLTISLSRWEDVTAPEPDRFDRFDMVEDWYAELQGGGRSGPVASTLRLVTTDPTTWYLHGWLDKVDYNDNSDIFVVQVSASTDGKGKAIRVFVSDRWMIDCDRPTSPVVRSFTSPWIPFSTENGSG